MTDSARNAEARPLAKEERAPNEDCVGPLQTAQQHSSFERDAAFQLAQLYRQAGFHLFALLPGTKKPAMRWGGLKLLPSIEPEFWRKHPDFGIAIACGSASGFFALDVDMGAGKGGGGTFRVLCDRYGPVPRTPTVITGSNGLHCYFQPPSFEFHNSSGEVGPGIDIKTAGGFVVAPSRSPHPKTGKPYRWLYPPWETPIAPAPGWLLQALRPPPPRPPPQPVSIERIGWAHQQGGDNSPLTRALRYVEGAAEHRGARRPSHALRQGGRRYSGLRARRRRRPPSAPLLQRPGDPAVDGRRAAALHRRGEAELHHSFWLLALRRHEWRTLAMSGQSGERPGNPNEIRAGRSGGRRRRRRDVERRAVRRPARCGVGFTIAEALGALGQRQRVPAQRRPSQAMYAPPPGRRRKGSNGEPRVCLNAAQDSRAARRLRLLEEVGEEGQALGALQSAQGHRRADLRTRQLPW